MVIVTTPVNGVITMPPLGLVTVAAILPQDWNFKLVDVNIRPVSDQEWLWADLVIRGKMSNILLQNLNTLIVFRVGGDELCK
jgi:hypothetical protein